MAMRRPKAPEPSAPRPAGRWLDRVVDTGWQWDVPRAVAELRRQDPCSRAIRRKMRETFRVRPPSVLDRVDVGRLGRRWRELR